jgi:hypothetical protein
MKNLREIMTDNNGNIRDKASFNYADKRQFLKDTGHWRLIPVLDKETLVEEILEDETSLQHILDKLNTYGVKPRDACMSWVVCGEFEEYHTVVQYMVEATPEIIESEVTNLFDKVYEQKLEMLVDFYKMAKEYGYTLQEM